MSLFLLDVIYLFSEMFTRLNSDGEAEINNYLFGVTDVFHDDFMRIKEIYYE